MIIIFNGDTLALMKRLQQFAQTDEKTTLDFMLENFKILRELSSYTNISNIFYESEMDFRKEYYKQKENRAKLIEDNNKK